MAALIVQLGKGVRDLLNAGSFSQTFEAVWEYVPVYEIPSADTLRVVVTDAGGEIDLATKALVYEAGTDMSLADNSRTKCSEF